MFPWLKIQKLGDNKNCEFELLASLVTFRTKKGGSQSFVVIA